MRRARRVGGTALATTVACVFLSLDAHAQSSPNGMPDPTPGLPPVQVIKNPFRTGDTQSPASGLPYDLGMTPLRLSLTGDAIPLAHAFPGCAEKAEMSGNTLHGFTLNRSFAMQLVPSLTLVGFSQTACQMDAAVGTGFVTSTRLRKDVWLAASAGAMIFPHGDGGTRASVKSDARVDVIWKDLPGRSFSVGVGLRGVRVGGVF
jgi:hypothetical protein